MRSEVEHQQFKVHLTGATRHGYTAKMPEGGGKRGGIDGDVDR